MALTKKQLKAMGIDDDKIEVIMEGHIESIEALQNKVASLEADHDKPETDAAKKGSDAHAKDSEGETAKDSGKDTVNDEIKALKQQIADMQKAAKDKEVKEQKTGIAKAMLEKSNISQDWIPYILKVFDFDAIKLNKDGTASNEDELVKGIQTDWAKCVQTVTTKGAETATPPDGEAKKDEPNQAFIDRIAKHRTELYGTQPETTTEGG